MFRTIIDGYNLIFQCGWHGKDLSSPAALEKSRRRLIDELSARVEKSRRSRLLIVFDAKDTSRLPDHAVDQLLIDGFTVRFARDFPDADALLAELIRTHSQPKQLTVVSSDHAVQTAATRRNARAIDSDVWFDSLPLVKSRPSNKTAVRSDSPLSPADQELLRDEFEQIDVTQLEREIDGPTKEEFGASQDAPQHKDSIELDDDMMGDDFNPFPPGYGEDLIE